MRDLALPEYTTNQTLRSHLGLIHGMYVGDVKTLEGLEEAHAHSHAEPDRPWYLDHHHDSGVGSQVTPGSGLADAEPVCHPDDCECAVCGQPEEWTW